MHPLPPRPHPFGRPCATTGPAAPGGRATAIRRGRSMLWLLLALTATLTACDRMMDRKPRVSAPPESMLAPVAEQLAPKAPTESLAMHLDGFVFRSGDLGSQHRTQQFCGHVGEQMLQCALFDGTGSGARLTGVQYVISEAAFERLPDEEKPYWHSLVHPVKAGTLVAPGLTDAAEHALVSRLVRTYAKTWRLWPTETDARVPLGVPQLMMGFTREGQLDPVMLAERDRQIGVATAEKRRQRQGIPAQPVAPGADAWQQGRVAQVRGAVGDEPVTGARR